jgi:acid phosphatase (class A)
MPPHIVRPIALALVLAGCATVPQAVSGKAEADMRKQAESTGLLAGGYLEKDQVPDSLTINPPPPAAGSAAELRDKEGAADALARQGSARFRLARVDADIFTPSGESVFSCAAGLVISEKTTPRTHALLRKTIADLGRSTSPTKQKYMRARPFMENGKPTCTPDHEDMLRGNGSYPSGHSAIGYGWGLILAEIVPDRAAELVSRGIAFGDSRRVCNVHWLSDIEEGRNVAAAVVARLHADAQFNADAAAAREEIASLRATLPKPDCALEEAAFGD